MIPVSNNDTSESYTAKWDKYNEEVEQAVEDARIQARELVHCVLVTGEIGKGFYGGVQKSDTGSYLVEDFRSENGQFADYAWASKVAIA